MVIYANVMKVKGNLYRYSEKIGNISIIWDIMIVWHTILVHLKTFTYRNGYLNLCQFRNRNPCLF